MDIFFPSYPTSVHGNAGECELWVTQSAKKVVMEQSATEGPDMTMKPECELVQQLQAESSLPSKTDTTLKCAVFLFFLCPRWLASVFVTPIVWDWQGRVRENEIRST